jgi:hypothetical protein
VSSGAASGVIGAARAPAGARKAPHRRPRTNRLGGRHQSLMPTVTVGLAKRMAARLRGSSARPQTTCRSAHATRGRGPLDLHVRPIRGWDSLIVVET